eukprot:2751274-Alexandrium_andersonii.AAC.1
MEACPTRMLLTRSEGLVVGIVDLSGGIAVWRNCGCQQHQQQKGRHWRLERDEHDEQDERCKQG